MPWVLKFVSNTNQPKKNGLQGKLAHIKMLSIFYDRKIYTNKVYHLMGIERATPNEGWPSGLSVGFLNMRAQPAWVRIRPQAHFHQTISPRVSRLTTW